MPNKSCELRNRHPFFLFLTFVRFFKCFSLEIYMDYDDDDDDVDVCDDDDDDLHDDDDIDSRLYDILTHTIEINKTRITKTYGTNVILYFFILYYNFII